MLKLLKPAVIAIQATLGVALSASWSLPALADAPPANTATQNQTTALLHTGDLVRLRSGGPRDDRQKCLGQLGNLQLVE
jgi:hypothetical protein